MNTEVEYYARDVYGRENLYVLDEEKAQAIRILTGKKTIDAGDIHALGMLGVTMVKVARK